ncbi:unnamed protein product [Sphenostylis stenocarpa]|uniref:Uncharacterized protein n=1 Tax=Sphenostylis stenocarpa TaxID=92480 RepID=A0AA86VD57_9FABA|nr:unnamed protein product [Sphenostylis stenocarpa]
MKSLEILSLNTNKLQGEIPVSFGNICTLQELHLDNNNLSGEISNFIQNSSWCNRHVFQILDLSHNKIGGNLDNLSICSSLRMLDLSNNQLKGEIPKSIGLLDELEELHLKENYFEGDVNELHLTNLSKLEKLDLSDNSLSVRFGTTWIPTFQLVYLRLASCKLCPSFPSWLHTQGYLNCLDISDTEIDDYVPDWFWNKLQSIREMNISYNSLKGITCRGIPTCLRNFTTMMEKGVVKSEGVYRGGYAIYDSNVLLMWKGQEHMYWNPENFLKSIDLSSNDLTGEIPKEVGYLLGLVSLKLSRSNLGGEIPCDIGSLILLEFLDLSRNQFSGKIPSALSKIDRLAVLDLSNNFLIGRIPWGRQLQTFDASSFEGDLDLCGEQLNKSCLGDNTTTKPQGVANYEDDNSLFYEALYMSKGLGFFTDYIILMVEVNPSAAGSSRTSSYFSKKRLFVMLGRNYSWCALFRVVLQYYSYASVPATEAI